MLICLSLCRRVCNVLFYASPSCVNPPLDGLGYFWSLLRTCHGELQITIYENDRWHRLCLRPTWAQQAKQSGCIDRHESREYLWNNSFRNFTLFLTIIAIYSSPIFSLIFIDWNLETIFIIHPFSFSFNF